jgi:hypothetical protein
VQLQAWNGNRCILQDGWSQAAWRVINLPKLASILPLIVALAQGKGGALMGFLTLYQATFESTAAAATG